jgi:GAF domain-containing protein/PAS domain-containing protein
LLERLRPERERADRPEPALLAELDTARAGLRAADAELRTQRAALDAVDGEHERLLDRRWRVSSMLPVPVLRTDRASRVVSANDAAASRLGAPADALARELLLTFVHSDDQLAVRQLLESAAEQPSRLGARLLPRRAGPLPVEPLPVELVVSAEVSPDLLTWTVLEEGGGVAGDAALACALVDVCELAASARDRHALLVATARAVLLGVHGAEATSASLGPCDAPTAIGYAGELASTLDGLQLRCGEGPSMLAERSGDAVVTPDLTTDARWPRLARLAAGAGVRSVAVVPVRVAGEQVGLLTSCSPGVRSLGPGQRDAAVVLAGAVGSVLAGLFERERLGELAGNLDRALVSRQEIDEAKGVVIAQRGCTPDEAFAFLAELSQRQNVKLRDLAHRIVAQAGLPAEPEPRAGRPPIGRRRG